MKMHNILLALAAPLFLACSSDDDIMGTVPTEIIAPTTDTEAQLNLNISTDKALYSPGEVVKFSAEGSMPSGAIVRYRQGSDVIGEEPLSGSSWSWTAPQNDFTGYLVDVYTTDGASETI